MTDFESELLDFFRERGRASIPEFQQHFALDYARASRYVNEFVARGALKLDEGIVYEYRDPVREFNRPRPFVDPFDADVDDENDEDDFEENPPEFVRRLFESRRRRKDAYDEESEDEESEEDSEEEWEETEEEDSEETEEEDSEETEEEDSEESEEEKPKEHRPPFPFLRRPDGSRKDEETEIDDLSAFNNYVIFAVLRRLSGIVEERRRGEEIFLYPRRLRFCGTQVKFGLVAKNNGRSVYMTDLGCTLSALSRRVSLEQEGMEEEIAKILKEQRVEVHDQVLCVELQEPLFAPSDMMRLFAAMERVYGIRERDIAMRAFSDKVMAEICNVAKGFLGDDPSLSRENLILCFMECYKDKKDSMDTEKIIFYAAAVKRLTDFTEREYVTFIMTLLFANPKEDPYAWLKLCARVLEDAIGRGEIGPEYICSEFSVGSEKANELINWMSKNRYIFLNPGEITFRVLLTPADFDRMYKYLK